MFIRRHLSYANVAATMALVFAMGGTAIAAKHYLITSTKQIKPSVLKALTGNTGKTGPAGPQGIPGAPGGTGSTGKEGPQGPGATQLDLELPASTSPSFSKVGSVAGINFEAKCGENAGTHEVTLTVDYTSASVIKGIATETEVLNGETAPIGNYTFEQPATATPGVWSSVKAQEERESVDRLTGNDLSPKLMFSESYVAHGGSASTKGSCTTALGFTPAS